ncbi:MAG: type III-A CRISPR-associated protein Cas10/Csm1 [Bacteroidia bacterium]
MDKELLHIYKNAFLHSVKPDSVKVDSTVGKAASFTGSQRKSEADNRILSSFAFGSEKGNFYIPSTTLSLEERYLFPSEEAGESAAKLIEDFVKSLDKIKPNESVYGQAEQILSLAHYHLATVPVDHSEASLYDQARLTAAVAVCLSADQDAESALLIKGDLSGIQDFIFDVVSDGAARSLKGRSFRVQMLTRMYVDYLLEKLDLSPANLLYEGGGNFYILAPTSAKDDIGQFRKDMSEHLLELEAKSDPDFMPVPEKLRIFVAAEEIPLENLTRSISQTWQKVADQISEERLRYHKGIDYKKLFTPLKPISQTDRRKVEAENYKEITGQLKNLEGISILPQTNGISRATQTITKDTGSKTYTFPAPFSVANRKISFSGNGEKKWSFFHKINENYQQQPFLFAINQLPVWTPGLINFYQEEINTYIRELARDEEDRQPPKADRLIEFAYLSLFAKKRTGTAKLGILKMDVDNLGKSFTAHGRTLLQNMALSRAMKWFFEGHLHTILSQEVNGEKLSDNLYVLYSGGDDFFVVGAWDMVIEFAWKMHDAFRKFTKGTRTISAGVVMVDSKFPVSRFAQLASEALEEAKIERDNICVFGQPLKWAEFKEARAISDTLRELVTKEENPESRAIITKVRNSMRGFEKINRVIRQRRSLDLSRFWRLNYYLRDTKKENLEVVKKDIIQKYERWLKEHLQHPKAAINPGLIAVGARMAEFLTRNIDSNQN